MTRIAVMLAALVGALQSNPPAAGNPQNGKELYVKYSCYACHGYDGHGGAGARLVPMRMNLPGFSAYIRNPRQMPPYTAKVLSDEQAAEMTDDDRREFVRANLKLLAAAAADQVRETDPDALTVLLERLSGQPAQPREERRRGDRRKGSDRRKSNLGPPSSGDRRRGGDPRGA